jgi:hypothetical protein
MPALWREAPLHLEFICDQAHISRQKNQQQGKTSMSVVTDTQFRPDRRRQPDATGSTRFPGRPNSRILSEAIPLYFIARNQNGLWVVHEAAGRCCGVFLFRRSALRFARKSSAPAGCATMFLTERFELDAHSQGNALVVWIDAALRMAARYLRSHAVSHTMAGAIGPSHVTRHITSHVKGARP